MIKCECGDILHRNYYEEKYNGEICLKCPSCEFEHFNSQEYFSKEELSDSPILKQEFCYNERNDLGEDIIETITSEDIIKQWKPKWINLMITSGKKDLINNHNCIQDFLVTYYGWENK